MAAQAAQPDKLLTSAEAAARLGLSYAMFWRITPRLTAKGLRSVAFQGRGVKPTHRYSERSINELIARVATSGETI